MLLLLSMLGCSGGLGLLPDTAGRVFDVDSADNSDTSTPTDDDTDVDDSDDSDDDSGDSDDDSGVDPGLEDGPGAVYASCDAADAGVELTSGHFVGEVAGWTSDVDPDCAPAGASGAEVVGRLELADLEWVRLSWSVAGRDAVLMLTEGCESASACEVSSDAAFAGGGESLSWLNDTGGAVTRYVVADTFGALQDGDAYTLDVERIAASAWPGQDSCDATPLLQPGAYLVELDASGTDDLTLSGPCAGSEGGVDTHAHVSVRDGQTLSIRAEVLDGVVATGVLLDCDGVCASEADGTFVNTSGGTLTPRVVVEAVGGPARALVVVSLQ